MSSNHNLTPATKDITYPNALASTGKIVNVSDPEFQDRSLTFTCLGCGEPMVAVHRTTGQSHFRHLNSNPDCNPQTYLHRLAKRKYKEWFDSGKPFEVTYKSKDLCTYFNICHYRKDGEEVQCMSDGQNTIDLHSLYDTCQEEVGYKGFIADLLLTNSQKPEQEPLFLEIAVTHKCEEEKIASGIQIIELDIQTEDDIKLPITEIGDITQGTASAAIYNFDRKVISKKVYTTHQIKSSGIVKDYRGLTWNSREGRCRELLANPDNRYLVELYFSKEKAEEIGEGELKKLAWANLALRGVYPDFCLFCNKARFKDPETKKFGDYFCKRAEASLLKSLRCPGFEYDEDTARYVIDKNSQLNCLIRGIKKHK